MVSIRRTNVKRVVKKSAKGREPVLEMETSGAWEVKRWIMSFGADAEVIEPVEMSQEIKKTLLEALKSYSH